MAARHILVAVLITLVWGGNFVAVRAGLDAGLPPLLFAALRFVVVSAFMLVVPRPAGIPMRMLAWLGLLLGAGNFGLVTLSLAWGLSAGISAVIGQVQVFFTLGLAAVLLREPVRLPVVAGAVAAFIGVAMLGLKGGSHVTALGIVASLGSAACWAYGIIVVKTLSDVDMFALTAWSGPMAFAVLLLLSLLTEGVPTLPAQAGLGTWALMAGTVAYAGIMSSLVGISVWNGLMHRYPAQAVAPFALLVPVFGLALSALLLGERLDGWAMAATALVLLGLVPAVLPQATRPSPSR